MSSPFSKFKKVKLPVIWYFMVINLYFIFRNKLKKYIEEDIISQLIIFIEYFSPGDCFQCNLQTRFCLLPSCHNFTSTRHLGAAGGQLAVEVVEMEVEVVVKTSVKALSFALDEINLRWSGSNTRC